MSIGVALSLLWNLGFESALSKFLDNAVHRSPIAEGQEEGKEPEDQEGVVGQDPLEGSEDIGREEIREDGDADDENGNSRGFPRHVLLWHGSRV